MSKRKTKHIKIGSVSVLDDYYFEDGTFNSIEDVVSAAKKIFEFNDEGLAWGIENKVKKYINKYSRFTFKLTTHSYEDVYGYGMDDTYVVEIWGHRPETDAEYNYRLKIEAAAKAKKEKLLESKRKKEQKEYERPKKKYG